MGVGVCDPAPGPAGPDATQARETRRPAMIDRVDSQRPELDLVIPVYNEEPGIPALLERLRSVLDQLDDIRVGVIFVDDHSTDATPELLRAACVRGQGYGVLRLSRNCGSHVAVLAGLANSRADCAVFLAADLQDPPELIPRMLELWRSGEQVVWAVRERREGVSLRERLLSRAFYWLLGHVGQVRFPPTGADFALLDRKVIDALLASVGAHPSIGGAIAWLGFREAHIPYTKEARKFGRSKWNLSKRLKAFADAFVSFSFVPIRVMSYTGIVMAILGFLYACVIAYYRLMHKTKIEGYASLMVAILCLGGVQMTMLGVLGEYLWRTLEEARKRPLYFLEATYGSTVPSGAERQEVS